MPYTRLYEYGLIGGYNLFSAAGDIVLYWLTVQNANFFKYLIGPVSLLRAPPPCCGRPEIARSEPNFHLGVAALMVSGSRKNRRHELIAESLSAYSDQRYQHGLEWS